MKTKEEIELIGEVDVEKKAAQNTDTYQKELGYIQGYKQALKDNKEKKYTEKELNKAIEFGYQLRNNNKPINSGIDWVKEFNSLNKQD